MYFTNNVYFQYISNIFKFFITFIQKYIASMSIRALINISAFLQKKIFFFRNYINKIIINGLIIEIYNDRIIDKLMFFK